MNLREKRSNAADILAIGLGPFNLGLAALSEPLGLSVRVLEAKEEFSWHPGMMVEGATIQVPFMADLVTMADPTSPYSFLNYLKQVGRLYPFYIRESFNPLRAEYDRYCRWVAERLDDSIRYRHRVVALRYDETCDLYEAVCEVDGRELIERGRHLVLGVGTTPYLPEALEGLGDRVIHTADYLDHRERLLTAPRVLVVGSGQSAAETFHDLLQNRDLTATDRLGWITRSPRFFPMEYTKLTLEMTSPEYIDHFHALDEHRRDTIAREQRHLYKGISGELIDEIHETLYRLSLDGPLPVSLTTGLEVRHAERTDEGVRLTVEHADTGEQASLETNLVLAGTGYRSGAAPLVTGLPGITSDGAGRPEVTRDYALDGDRGRVFAQNAEEHTHFLTAPDLGMGAYRNSVILARILGREVYPIERRIAFQTFGVPA